MNWFKLLSILIGAGSAIADPFIKNPDSQATKRTVVSALSTVIEGLANSNPDGTPASTPYVGPPARVADQAAVSNAIVGGL